MIKTGIRSGTGSAALGRDDKPSTDSGEPMKKGAKKLLKKKAKAFGKLKK